MINNNSDVALTADINVNTSYAILNLLEVEYFINNCLACPNAIELFTPLLSILWILTYGLEYIGGVRLLVIYGSNNNISPWLGAVDGFKNWDSAKGLKKLKKKSCGYRL